jgi:hypothetical protein
MEEVALGATRERKVGVAGVRRVSKNPYLSRPSLVEDIVSNEDLVGGPSLVIQGPSSFPIMSSEDL